MMQEQLFLDQNPWKQHKPINFLQETITRSFVQDIIKYLDKRETPILIGARQTGKSTALYQVIDHLLSKKQVDPKSVFYFSLDDLDLRREFQENPKAIIQYLEMWLGENISDYDQKIYLFIDEAQKAPLLFEILKLLFDVYKNKIKIILSGSSSLELKKITTESLAGRIVYFSSYPFTIREIYELEQRQKIEVSKFSRFFTLSKSIDLKILKQRQAELLPFKSQIEKIIRQMLILGSLPPLFKIEEVDEQWRFLNSYKTAYIEKDIVFLKEVGNSLDYLKLLEAISSQAGALLNISMLSQKLGISINTIKKYIQVLQDTHIIDLLPAYAKNAKIRLIKAPKILLFDNFLMSIVDQIATYNDLVKYNFLGRYLENFLIQEIKKDLLNLPQQPGWYFWRTSGNQEVDFILQLGRKIIPIEIKAGQNIEVRCLTGLNAFLRHHPDMKQAIVLYQGNLKQEGKVLFVPIWLIV